MELVVVVLVVVVLVVGAAVAAARRRPGERRRGSPAADSAHVSGTIATRVVTLDIQGGDPDDPSVRRLVEQVAADVFASDPQVTEVEVRSREDRRLGHVRRQRPAPRTVVIPDELYEPHTPRDHTPDVVRPHTGPVARPPVTADEVDLDVPGRPLADRFELPEAVRAELGDPDDPVELVRALLAVAGRPAEVQGNVVRSGDDVLIVLRQAGGHAIGAEALSEAYLRFHETGAPRGVAICLGYVDPAECRRRELLAPALQHAGADAIQRMADALALGGDPVRFAIRPPVTR